MGGIVWEHASRDAKSSVTVQKAVAMIADNIEQQRDGAWAMTQGMSGHVVQACESKFANFVLSKMFAELPTNFVSCLVEELRGHAVCAAQSPFGYRCIMLLVEHHATSTSESVLEVMHE